MGGTSKTSAANNLFKTNKIFDILSKDKEQPFHHLVAKLLYLRWRNRQDIQMALAFLCTRVKKPDKDEYKKSPE